MDTRQRSDQAEAAVRASEQRAREGADEKTKKLLLEMENLCQVCVLFALWRPSFYVVGRSLCFAQS